MTHHSGTNHTAQQAREWFVHLQSGEASAADRARFKNWFKADSAHRIAYDRIAGIWSDAEKLTHLAALEPRYQNPNSDSRRLPWWRIFKQSPALLSVPRLSVAVSAVAATLILAMSVWLLNRDLGGSAVNYETATAQIDELVLEDGTMVTLGPRSELAVQFSAQERRVLLIGGEAFFDVEHDHDRPFIVEVNGTLVQVVGTKFNVHAGSAGVTVGVQQGVVDVTKSEAGVLPFLAMRKPETKRLNAGEQVVALHQGKLAAVKPVQVDTLGAWRSGHLIYDNVSLRDVISDANRYSVRDILLATDEVADLTVTAAFRTDEIDKMIHSLAAVLPITLDYEGTSRILIKPK